MEKKPLVNIQKAIEHGRLQLIYPLKMVIFHSYVSLPEGSSMIYLPALQALENDLS